MPLIKRIQDHFLKLLNGKDNVPRGLYEMDQYFRINGAISFKHEREKDTIIAISDNFRQGTIITSGKNKKELDKNIKDAIMTAFEIPSSYANEAKIHQVGKEQKEYALS